MGFYEYVSTYYQRSDTNEVNKSVFIEIQHENVGK